MTKEMELLEHAQRMAEQFNDHALQLQQRRQRDSIEPQWIVDGQVVCLGCERPVPVARMNAVPNACRCVDCQNIIDKQRAHFATRNPWK